MGRQAAQVVLDRIKDGEQVPRRIIFDAELVVRGSSRSLA
jgi:DNA-binding LacI/PurR family transcriptional regulator